MSELEEDPGEPSPGCWLTTEVPDPLIPGVSSIHVVKLVELRLGLHTLDHEGKCDCGPEDSNEDEVYQDPVWTHKELITLNG